MSWYWWVLLWVVLVLVGGGLLALLALSIWGKAKELLSELSTASERLAVVSDGLQELSERAADPAVFTPASQLRQERIISARRREGRHSAAPAPEVRRSSPGRRAQRVR